MKILKDQNLIMLNKAKTKSIDIKEDIRDEMLKQIELDSQLLKQFGLIDYSIFLI
jgi:hypothetical protein